MGLGLQAQEFSYAWVVEDCWVEDVFGLAAFDGVRDLLDAAAVEWPE